MRACVHAHIMCELVFKKKMIWQCHSLNVSLLRSWVQLLHRARLRQAAPPGVNIIKTGKLQSKIINCYSAVGAAGEKLSNLGGEYLYCERVQSKTKMKKHFRQT